MRWCFLAIGIAVLVLLGGLAWAEHTRDGSLSELRAIDAEIVKSLTDEGLRVLCHAPTSAASQSY